MAGRVNLKPGWEVLAFLLVLGALAQAHTITVGPGAGYDFNSIQAAINAGAEGSIIIVAEGTYFENIEVNRDKITLRSIDPNDPSCVAKTVIDGGQNGPVVTFIIQKKDAESTLDGFTITNGYRDGLYGGGGVSCYSDRPIVTNCIITGNVNGGIYYSGGTLSPRHSPTIANCSVTANLGSGIHCRHSEPIIANSKITENADSGIYCYGSRATIANCTINGNSRGGIRSQYGGLTIANCTIAGNAHRYDPWSGGGIRCLASDLDISNCTIHHNLSVWGGGIASDRAPDVQGTPPGSLTVTGCILWHNQPQQILGDHGAVSYSDIQNGWPGQGNIDADPCFVDPGYWDPNGTPDDPNDDFWVHGEYHLKSEAGRWNPNGQTWVQDDVTSPCIDAGDPMRPIGQEPFPNGGVMNMGAYGGTVEAGKSYFGQPVCETIVAGDINGDCTIDLLDLVLMSAHWLEDNTIVTPPPPRPPRPPRPR